MPQSNSIQYNKSKTLKQGCQVVPFKPVNVKDDEVLHVMNSYLLCGETPSEFQSIQRVLNYLLQFPYLAIALVVIVT